MAPSGKAALRNDNNMTRFDSLDAKEKTPRSGLRHQRQELGDSLLVRCIRYFRKRMQTLRHAGEGHEFVAAVIMQGLLAQRIASQHEPPTRVVPNRESIIANETLKTGLIPSLNGGKKDRRVAKDACLRIRNPQSVGQFVSVVQPYVGDEHISPPAAYERLTIEDILRQ